MMELKTITIGEYLTRKGVEFRESGNELIAHCLFNDCDADSRGAEAHLYFKAETGQYECKKCGEKGNTITLAKHFGDGIQEIALNPLNSKENPRESSKFDAERVETCHQALPANIRQYLNTRGITDAVIDEHKLGWGKFYHKWWITIPIKDVYGAFRFFKLRQDPNAGNDKITYPNGGEAQIYGWETLQSGAKRIVICEGELDRLSLLSKGVPAITSTHGAMTFKNEWCEKIGKGQKIYICFDNDEAGRKGAERVAKMVENSGNETFIVVLPNEVGDGGDITDYLVKLNGDPNDLFGKYANAYPEKIDTSQFRPMTSEGLLKILGETIKKDDANKIITFLCLLTAYTEDSQFNISFNAPSSTGKSYIPLEVATLFPDEDVMEISYASPTAFYHKGEWIEKEDNGKKKGYLKVDLERKILIFIDQQNPQLLERLRSLLSHDKKEIRLEITDKKASSGIKTKEVIIRGFPSVVFCTAGLKMDEQENTRLILLSPETNQEKLRLAILEKVRRETDKRAYFKALASNPDRKLLTDRIRAIKQANIDDIVIDFPEKIINRFFADHKVLRPKHQRDIGRLLNLIKAFTLLNLWFRRQANGSLFADETDLNDALRVWAKISESQEYNLPPYVFNLFRDVILVAYARNNSEKTPGITPKIGVSKKQIMKVHQEVVGKFIEEWRLRLEIFPMLENAGLLTSEPNPLDKRELLYTPLPLLTIVSADSNEDDVPDTISPNNSEKTPGEMRKENKYSERDNNFLVAESIRLKQQLTEALGEEKNQIEEDLAEIIDEGLQREMVYFMNQYQQEGLIDEIFNKE